MDEAVLTRETVLVVDDDERVLKTFSRYVEMAGFDVITATNGRDALDIYAREQPVLVLVDVRMPYVDGFEVLKTIRERDAEAEVILITGHSDMEMVIDALRATASDFIPKPVDLPALDAALARARARLRLKRELRAERAKFAWVVAQAQDGYLMLDADGRARYANPQARLYLGLAPDDALPDEPFIDLARRHYHLQPDAAWSDWPAPDTEDAAPRYLLRPESATASALWLKVACIEMTEGQERHLVRLHDVTAAIVTQNLIWSVDTLISYKLRNPLGQLTGFLSLLEADLPELSIEEIQADLAEAQIGATQLQDTILDVLQYLEAMNIAQGRQTACGLCQLPDLVAQIQAELRLDTVTVDIVGLDVERAQLPLSARALELILWELCENAKKFHPEHAPAVDIRVAAEDDGLILRVQDDGQHLPPDLLGKIWIPYYQGEKLFTGEVPGVGLGLPTVASLVWGVGGTCRAYNREDGPGLVVELHLPLAGERDANA